MGTLGNAVLIGLVFVAAVLALLFGFRRVRAPVLAERRGFLGRVRTAFLAAAGFILGTSASCAEDGDDDVRDVRDRPPDATDACYADVNEVVDDGWAPPDDARDDAPDATDACYADVNEVEDDGWAPPDADADGDVGDDGLDAPPDVEPDVEPDADVPDVEEPDAGSADAFVGLAPEERQRREKWARRTLERAREVRRLLADPGVDPTVREVLRADVRRLRRRVQRARRWVRENGSGGGSVAV
jgi:hypothetical protein